MPESIIHYVAFSCFMGIEKTVISFDTLSKSSYIDTKLFYMPTEIWALNGRRDTRSGGSGALRENHCVSFPTRERTHLRMQYH